jgi:hypothetical protein
MESKKGAFVVLGLLLVVSVVLLIVAAKHGGQGDSDFNATLANWKNGLLAKFAKSQELAAGDLSPNPFKANGEYTLATSVPLTCKVAPSKRAVRKATLELAGPGTVEVDLIARRKGHDLECKKTLQRSSASGDADDKAKVVLTAFEDGGTLTLSRSAGPAAPVVLRWKVE